MLASCITSYSQNIKKGPEFSGPFLKNLGDTLGGKLLF
jgi:hypothetical protein